MHDRAYWGELWRERRALSAAALGTGFSISLNMFVASLFIPAMQAEFGWSGSQISFLGTFTLLGLLSFPLAGRLADMFGSRRVMLGGIVVIPGCFLLSSLQQGEIWQFAGIQALWWLLAPLWSATVLGRVAAGRLTLARGFGIALLLSAPAIVGAAGAPLLTEAVAAYGWRVAYRLLAAAVLAAGIVAVIFLPGQHAPNAAKSDTRPSREAYRHILRSRPFLILACAMLLCNLGTIITGLQFAPMLIERGVGATMVGGFLSAYALGVIAGRIAIGLSLDRLPSRYVAAVGMGMPALGFALLAGVPGSVSIALFAVILLGVSQGAEGDIAGYIGAQYFGPHVFGTIFGLVTAVTSLAGFIGSMLSGVLLQGDSSFVPFLLFLAITTALGSGAFLLLPRERGKYDARIPVAPAPTQ